MATKAGGSAAASGAAAPVLNPMRFMQLALATTVLFTVVYMGQFISSSVSGTTSNTGGAVAASTGNSIRRNSAAGNTQLVIQGFEAAYKFVSEYDVKTQGPLYMLFMADADENGTYWCPDCQKAKKPVYDVFARAPRGSRLVEIRIGSRDYWNDDNNEFRQNELFYLDYIPSLLRYDGGGNSSHMLNEQYTLDYDLLEYFFRVPYPAAGVPNKNEIVTLDTASSVQEFVLKYDSSYPLFIFFVSGYHSFNGRLWCPFCDRADLAIMHYYNYSAPDNAVLVRAIVSHSYKMWKKKKNPFKLPEFRENVVTLRGVPYLGRVTKDDATNKVVLKEYTADFCEKQKIVNFFGDKPW